MFHILPGIFHYLRVYYELRIWPTPKKLDSSVSDIEHWTGIVEIMSSNLSTLYPLEKGIWKIQSPDGLILLILQTKKYFLYSTTVLNVDTEISKQTN